MDDFSRLSHHHQGGFQESSVTLLIRHLPEAIPQEALSRLFSYYGASSVRPCIHGRVKNCAFVDFKSEGLASQALKQLHGLQFLGKTLSIERANVSLGDSNQQERGPQARKEVTSSNKIATRSEDLCDVSKGASHPIAEKLGIDYPFPPHFEYAYPPPDGNILANIMNALIAVPRFYTQVLHLMNKMNIPAPFRKAMPIPPLPVSVPAPPPPLPASPPPDSVLLTSENNMDDLSGSESESEFSDEDKVEPKRKRIKKAIVGPAIDKDVTHETVGLKSASLVPKEKPLLKKKNPLLQIRIAPKNAQPEKKDDGDDKELHEPIQGNSDTHLYATPEELNRGKLPPEEILSLPKFKNYVAGDPTPVLYMKNLAKDVIISDFYYIFGSFFGSLDAAKSDLTIKLMQEGRMRGQAFVTFPTVELAQDALNLVNGYVFKGKPIIIQFGRSTTTAKPS